jgi:translation initiation factor RLI1
VNAIPTLSLEQKRVQVIGQAVIDQERCIPWAEEQDCIVCEEMCPLPEKAIVLETVEVNQVINGTFTVQRPEVLEDECIGCGICEYKCPVEGEAAIRIYVPDDLKHSDL